MGVNFESPAPHSRPAGKLFCIPAKYLQIPPFISTCTARVWIQATLISHFDWEHSAFPLSLLPLGLHPDLSLYTSARMIFQKHKSFSVSSCSLEPSHVLSREPKLLIQASSALPGFWLPPGFISGSSLTDPCLRWPAASPSGHGWHTTSSEKASLTTGFNKASHPNFYHCTLFLLVLTLL